jgi:DNA topoisomerase IB
MNRFERELLEHIGSKRGHFKFKSNRIAKLIEMWPVLESKFIAMIHRGRKKTAQARFAYATLLMMETGLRTGNETSAEGWVCENQIVCKKDNPDKGLKVGDIIWRHPLYGQHVQTFGLTTLMNSHVRRFKGFVRIDFVGKKLVDQRLYVYHPEIVQYCPRGKSNELFLEIDYYSLKKFVKKYVGKNYTPKDIRMAKANLVFIEKLIPKQTEYEAAETKTARKRVVGSTIEETANVIGHTKGVCRSAYLSQPLIGWLELPPDAV